MGKLIILRGPSGAGKSTVAKMLHKTMGGKTALIEQDYIKLEMFDGSEESREAVRNMVMINIRAALDMSCDVVAEGFFNAAGYKERFEKLFEGHPEDNYLFYFDISFEETARRHATREKSQLFNPEDMKEWYSLASPYNHPHEHIIPENYTAKQMHDEIIETAGIKATAGRKASADAK
jgi:thymidylate kinase